MGLDYTAACVNFRDLGVFINLIADRDLFPVNKILRGGSTDYVDDAAQIGHPKTIINLRKGTDLKTFDLDYFHFPISNKYEKYHTEQQEVRIWLNAILKTFEDPRLKYPVFIHCLSGKDRTGIVIAAILFILGVSKEIIIEEYLLSDGEVKTERILTAIEGIQANKNYFNRLDIAAVKAHILA